MPSSSDNHNSTDGDLTNHNVVDMTATLTNHNRINTPSTPVNGELSEAVNGEASSPINGELSAPVNGDMNGAHSSGLDDVAAKLLEVELGENW